MNPQGRPGPDQLSASATKRQLATESTLAGRAAAPAWLYTSRLRQAERTASRVIGERAVVIVLDAQCLHVLSDVGTRVWGLLEDKTLGEVVDALLAEFDVERERLERDVARFFERLWEVGALSGSAPDEGSARSEDSAVAGA